MPMAIGIRRIRSIRKPPLMRNGSKTLRANRDFVLRCSNLGGQPKPLIFNGGTHQVEIDELDVSRGKHRIEARQPGHYAAVDRVARIISGAIHFPGAQTGKELDRLLDPGHAI